MSLWSSFPVLLFISFLFWFSCCCHLLLLWFWSFFLLLILLLVMCCLIVGLPCVWYIFVICRVIYFHHNQADSHFTFWWISRTLIQELVTEDHIFVLNTCACGNVTDLSKALAPSAPRALAPIAVETSRFKYPLAIEVLEPDDRRPFPGLRRTSTNNRIPSLPPGPSSSSACRSSLLKK